MQNRPKRTPNTHQASAGRRAPGRCGYRAAVGDEERPERGSLVLEGEHTIEDEELWEDDGSDDYLGWY